MKYTVCVVLLLNLRSVLCVPDDKLPIYKSILLAQCRARCLNKFLPDPVSVVRDSCVHNKECSMCWQTCFLFTDDLEVWGHMCTDERICFPGCVESCTFFVLEDHDIDDLNYDLLGTFRLTESLTVHHHPGSDKFVWGPPSSTNLEGKVVPDNVDRRDSGGIVYTLIEFNFDTPAWTEVNQTIIPQLYTESYRDKKVGFMLVAVNATHILTKDQIHYEFNPDDLLPDSEDAVVSSSSISPENADSGDDNALNPVSREVVKSDHVEGSRSPIESEAKPRFNRKDDTKSKPASWNVQVEKIQESQQLGMVEVHISWGDMTSKNWETPSYMVTWEKYGSREGLKAYRYTDTNRIKLSLLPESMYTIQVESFSSHYGVVKSPEVQISTHNIIRSDKLNDTLLRESLKNKDNILNVELMIGLAVGITSFALLMGTLVYLLYRKLNKKPVVSNPVSPIYPQIIVTDEKFKLSNMTLFNVGHSHPNLGVNLKDSCSLPNLKGVSDSSKSCFGLVYVPIPSAPPRSDFGVHSQPSDKSRGNRLEVPGYLTQVGLYPGQYLNPQSVARATIKEESL